MLLSIESDKPLARIREDLPRACGAHKFGVLAVHDLREKMHEKGVDYGGDCLVFEVCNPLQAKRVLEANPEISAALPCRISAYSLPGGRTRLLTMRPTLLVDLFQSKELQGVAEEVERTLEAILEDASRKP